VKTHLNISVKYNGSIITAIIIVTMTAFIVFKVKDTHLPRNGDRTWWCWPYSYVNWRRRRC